MACDTRRTPEAAAAKVQRPAELLRLTSPGTAGGGPGFLLTDVSFRPIYTNNAALRVLSYPSETRAPNPRDLQEQIRRILHASSFTGESRSTDFLSGRRRYVCRPFSLESMRGSARPSTVVILLERPSREPVNLSEVSRRFHLSPRERETVQYLIRGLTTKEVGERMSVSPNTVKQFVRLIMSKMRVTTRSGVVGKILGA